MDSEYIDKVKTWVSLDNKVTRTMDTIKSLKEDAQPYIDERKDVEEEILEYIQKNKYEKLTVNIADGTIKFGKKTTSTSLSMKLIKNLLEEYAMRNSPENIPHSSIYDFFIENIDKKTTYFIKRDIISNTHQAQ